MRELLNTLRDTTEATRTILSALLNASAAGDSTSKRVVFRLPPFELEAACSRGFCFLRVAELEMRSLDSAGVLGPRLPLIVKKKTDDCRRARRNLCERLGNEPRCGETAGGTRGPPAKVDLSKVPAGDSTTMVAFESCSTGSWDGALCVLVPKTWQKPREQRNPLDSQSQETPRSLARQTGEPQNPADRTLGPEESPKGTSTRAYQQLLSLRPSRGACWTRYEVRPVVTATRQYHSCNASV